MVSSSDTNSAAQPNRYLSGDLRAVEIPDLSNRDDPAAIIRELFAWVESFAVESINWYSREKVSKARWSRCLRLLAVLSFALGTVTPVVTVGMGWSKEAIWGYGLIGIGACCVAIDKVCGFSSSWMRYVSTAISLNRQLLMFQASWPRIEAKIARESNAEHFSQAVQDLVNFVDGFSLVMETETLAWVSEFQNHIIQLESGSIPALPTQSQR
ncbi:SLATT domain-containing protein [Streptomyces mirabilis]|uniref:SLATT domain-containing protein n=1 Tax=Streptomyces mirabilis TaxID=68239 RepID=UPI0015EF4EA5